MNRTILHLVILIPLFICAIIPLYAQDNIIEDRVRIKSITGKVMVRSPKAKQWRDARVGMFIKTKWDVRTFVESAAEIEFSNGSVIRISENSVVTLSEAFKSIKDQATRSSLKVSTGELWANVNKLLSKRSSFGFETPTATATIRGTRLGIKVKKHDTRIDVYDGKVLVKKKGARKGITVLKHTRVFVREDEDEIEVIRFTKESAKDPTIDPNVADQVPMEDPFVDEGTEKDTVVADSVQTELEIPDTGETDEQDDTVSTIDTTVIDTVSVQVDTVDDIPVDQELMLEILYPVPDQVMGEKKLVITCKTIPSVEAVVGNKKVTAGSDGVFSGMVLLKLGTNTITVSVELNNKTLQKEVTVEYRPPLFLNINNISDNMEVPFEKIELSIEVSEGAHFSVNGVENNTGVSLRQGENNIIVEAWDNWDNRIEKEFTVIYKKGVDFTLSLISPKNGAVFNKTIIPVSGKTLPGTRVYINGVEASVSSAGIFSYKVYIPDEEGEYLIRVDAEYWGREFSVERTIEYKWLKVPLKLVVTSPSEGQTIIQRSIKVNGESVPNASISVNGKTLNAYPSGVFSADIRISERDIGDYVLEVVASDDEDEIVKTINVIIDVRSPQVNTSAPVLVTQELNQQATRIGDVILQVLDRTPDDQITVDVTINGTKDKFTVDPGGSERLNLEEGKNVYIIKAFDRANNQSNVIQGVIYYLPSRPEIEIVEPHSNPYIIKGLPPMPQNMDNPVLDLEVEINDGIGDVVETIKYCRVKGNGQDKLLKNHKDYTFTGEFELTIGKSCTFMILIENMAGVLVTKPLNVIFRK